MTQPGGEKEGQRPSFLIGNRISGRLEQALRLARLHVHIHAREGGIGAGAGHEADRPCAGAEELGPGVDQHVPDGQGPTLGHAIGAAFLGKDLADKAMNTGALLETEARGIEEVANFFDYD